MLVSIIMPSYNQAQFLPQALDSVLNQCWGRLELIVMDAGSTDGTLEILHSYQQRDNRLRWWSAPDTGPADALNKALAKGRGTLVGWLNSDDCYTPGAIRRAATAMQKNQSWMLCYGWGQHIDAEGNYINDYPTLPALHAEQPVVPPAHLFQQSCFICQPSVFFKAVMPRLLGPLDQSLGASFDFDYWLRAFNAFAGRIGFVPAVQAHSRLHDACITQNQRRRVALEGMQVLAKHQGSAPSHWVHTYLKEQLQQGENPQRLKADLEDLLNKVQPLMQALEWQGLCSVINHRLVSENTSRQSSP